MYDENRCLPVRSFSLGVRTLSAPAPVTNVGSAALPLYTNIRARSYRLTPGGVRRSRRPPSQGQLAASCALLQPPAHPITVQVVALGVIGNYLQHQAYSFPADRSSAEPSLRSGRVRRPSVQIAIHNIWLWLPEVMHSGIVRSCCLAGNAARNREPGVYRFRCRERAGPRERVMRSGWLAAMK